MRPALAQVLAINTHGSTEYKQCCRKVTHVTVLLGEGIKFGWLQWPFSAAKDAQNKPRTRCSTRPQMTLRPHLFPFIRPSRTKNFESTDKPLSTLVPSQADMFDS